MTENNKYNHADIVSAFWGIANSTRGIFTLADNKKIILPILLMKRLDTTLLGTKEKVLEKVKALNDKKETDENKIERALKRASKKPYYNSSRFTFDSLLEDTENIIDNFEDFVNWFSPNVREILWHLDFPHMLWKLKKSNILLKLLNEFSQPEMDVSPDLVSNYEMWLIFEEMIRWYSESDATASWDFFTPRDIVHLNANLLLRWDYKTREDWVDITIYDPTCWTGWFLTEAKDLYIKESRENWYFDNDVIPHWQELMPEIYAMWKADFLIRWEDPDNIKWPASTLSQDWFKWRTFDYILANPPYWINWSKDEDYIYNNIEEKWEESPFKAWTPRTKDWQLLFIQHMIDKMHKPDENWKIKRSEIACVTNAWPLRTGWIWSWENDIRKWIFENDYLEAVIALPSWIFYNTWISTFIWIMSNNKSKKRKNKIQLIDAREMWSEVEEVFWSKWIEFTEENSEKIIKMYKEFKETDVCKIFDKKHFWQIEMKINIPRKDNYQLSEERIDNLKNWKAISKLIDENNFWQEEDLEDEKNIKNWCSIEAIAEWKIELKENIERVERIKSKLRDLWKDWVVYKKYEDIEKVLNEWITDEELEDFWFKRNLFVANVIDCISERDETAETVRDDKWEVIFCDETTYYDDIREDEDREEYLKEYVYKYFPDAVVDEKEDWVCYWIDFSEFFYEEEEYGSLEEAQKECDDIWQEIVELQKEL